MPVTPPPKPPCELCKQPVEISGFFLLTHDGLKQFCCAGCLSIYQLLTESKTPPPDNNN